MPELPEVETVKKSLQFLTNQTIENIDVAETRLRFPVDTRQLERYVKGNKIKAITRRSKYLIFHMENDTQLIIHLGMSGRLIVAHPSSPKLKHQHVTLRLSQTRELRFVDPRRFGMVAVHRLSTEEYIRFKNLGVEPLSKQCSAHYLFNLSRKSKKPIKNFIMDATKVVGIGNIYACESLFLSGIHPKRIAGNLSLTRWQRLNKVIKRVLRQAITKGGTTISDFRDGRGKQGYFQVYLRVYNRQGEPCKKCQTRIRKITLAGRSSYYCPFCQR